MTRPAAKGARRATRFAREGFAGGWWERIALAVIVAAAVALVARVATMAFGAGGKRLERAERQAERPPARHPDAPGRSR